MIDPVSFFTVVSAAGSGLVGNTAYAAAVHLIPQVQRWYKGEGQPVNHHLQRALRSAYLSATRDALKQADTRAPSIFDDTSAWCGRALEWVQAQSHLLKGESYHPPAPPGGWEPAHLVEPSAADAASEVSALRDGLRAMLLGEWAAENLRTPPAPVLAALGEPWFDSISLYFAQELKRLPQTEAIFHAGIESKILIELRALRREVAAGRGSEGAPAFFAPASPDYFVGREAALEILNSRLAEPGAVVPLSGMPGLGKTSLAITFAHHAREAFEGVYWLQCAGKTLPALAGDLARQCGISPEGEPETLVRDLRLFCAKRHYLLVLDNVELNDTALLLPDGSCSVLITTRRRDLPFLARYRQAGLEVFTPAECLALFRERLGAERVDADAAGYLSLAARFERLPVAVSVAAGLLDRDERYDLHRLLNEAKPHKLAHGDLDIGALLGAAVASAGSPARQLLAAMAVCAPSDFRLGLAAEIAGMETDAALDALQDLRSRSLADVFDRENRRYHLHSLIRAEAGQDPALERAHAEAVAREFKGWETDWRACEADLNDWRLALAWAAGGPPAASDRMGLLRTLAFSGFLFSYRRGLLADALRAMEIAAARFDLLWDRTGLQASYGNQAVILQAWGRLEEAMALHKRKEAICLELGDRTGLQRSYGNQALILKAWGQLEEAMALHKSQEAICLELGDRAGLQASYGNQAVILKHWGQLEEAMALHKSQEAICLELGDRAGLQASYGNQALIVKAWGRLEEAMALHKVEESICLELGDRAGLQRSYGNQALILKAWGRLEEAMALYKRKEAICRELRLQASLRISLHNQANLLETMGRPEDAAPLRQEAEAIHTDLMKGRGTAAWPALPDKSAPCPPPNPQSSIRLLRQ